MHTVYKSVLRWLTGCLLLCPCLVQAQTEVDAIMMNKNQICNGFLYNYSSWDHYWEGKLKRTNLNMGTVSTQSAMYMINYGITNDLNIIAGVPYVWTKASAGTLHGLNGIQDLSLNLKWRFFNQRNGNNKISVFAVGGFSTPLSNYTPDFLPLSIGLGSTNLSARGMVDYQYKKITVTGSAAYVWRSNIKIDRDSYYTDRLHITNEVQMPDMTNLQLRAGYRGKFFIAEGIVNRMITMGGFDITRNNMPFPSNRMNATTAGVFFKYTIPGVMKGNLELLAQGNYTVDGRNVGQSLSYGGGFFYAFYVKKNKTNTNSSL
ncbi:MAG: hypothetical protein ACTHMM_02370 [Agriterribacter sp.]